MRTELTNPVILVAMLLKSALTNILNDTSPRDYVKQLKLTVNSGANSLGEYINDKFRIGFLGADYAGLYTGDQHILWPKSKEDMNNLIAITYNGFVCCIIRPFISTVYNGHILYETESYLGSGNHDMSELECGQWCEQVLHYMLRDRSTTVDYRPIFYYHAGSQLKTFTLKSDNQVDIRWHTFGLVDALQIDHTMVDTNECNEQQAAICLGCNMTQLWHFPSGKYVICQYDAQYKRAYAIGKKADGLTWVYSSFCMELFTKKCEWLNTIREQ